MWSVDRQGPEHVLDADQGVVRLALPRAEGHREGQHALRARGEDDAVAQVPRGRRQCGGAAEGGAGRGGGSGHRERGSCIDGSGVERDGSGERESLRRQVSIGRCRHPQSHRALRLPRGPLPVPPGTHALRGPQPLRADRRGGGRQTHLALRVARQPRQVSRLHHPDPGRGEGAVPSAEEPQQHAQVRNHLPQQLHRTRGSQEQGTHLEISRQQVLDRIQTRLLRRGTHRSLRTEDEGTGGTATQLLRDGSAATEEHRRDARGGAGAEGTEQEGRERKDGRGEKGGQEREEREGREGQEREGR